MLSFWCIIFMSTSTWMPLSNCCYWFCDIAIKYITTTTMITITTTTTTTTIWNTGWKLFLTGMWHSLGFRYSMLILFALIGKCPWWVVQWFDLENPEEVECPGSYNVNCNAFQASAWLELETEKESKAAVYFRFACFQLQVASARSECESECLVLARSCRCHRALLDFVLYARF